MPTKQAVPVESVQVIDSTISLGSFEDFVSRILAFGKRNESTYTCCANVHMVVEAHRNPALQAIVNRADLVTADGMPLAKIIQLQYRIAQERVAGMDLFPALLKQAASEGGKVYFYGDTDEVLQQLSRQALTEFPGLLISGMESPPFRQLTAEEKQATVSRINGSGAHLVFVALGCPKQETWMAEHRGLINASMVGIGNAFRTYIGLEMRAPAWMQRASLEWLYRLIQNPRRLWKRYFVTNSLFLLLAIKKWPSARREI